MRTRCCTTLAVVLLLLTAACGGRGTDSANFARAFKITRDVVHEGIVVIDDEDHALFLASFPASIFSKLRKILSAFTRVSAYSSSTLDSPVIPPPTCNETLFPS